MKNRSFEPRIDEAWLPGILELYELNSIRSKHAQRWQAESKASNLSRPFTKKLFLLDRITPEEVMRAEADSDYKIIKLAGTQIPAALRHQVISSTILEVSGIRPGTFESRSELVDCLDQASNSLGVPYYQLVYDALLAVNQIPATSEV
jgi:hypothetical protein